MKSLKLEQEESNDITAINIPATFELYVLKSDLDANPIAGNAKVLRDQAIKDKGLCSIKFDEFEENTSSLEAWIDDVKNSVGVVVGQDDACMVEVCLASQCDEILDDEGEEVLGYEACDCDLVIDVEMDSSRFILYTGEPLYALLYLLTTLCKLSYSNLSHFTVPYKGENKTDINNITMISLFTEYSEWQSGQGDEAPDGAGDFFGIPCECYSVKINSY